MKQFYKYEEKLATNPIIEFIDKYGNRYHGRLVEIGCGNKPYLKYFSFVNEYIGVDVAEGEADIIVDAKSLPFPSDSVDIVLCTQVIEHDPQPEKIISEANRILKPGFFIFDGSADGKITRRAARLL